MEMERLKADTTVMCPACFRKNRPRKTFACEVCGRENLCQSHEEEPNVCKMCSLLQAQQEGEAPRAAPAPPPEEPAAPEPAPSPPAPEDLGDVPAEPPPAAEEELEVEELPPPAPPAAEVADDLAARTPVAREEEGVAETEEPSPEPSAAEDMILIPAGPFPMGDEGNEKNPRRAVEVEEFYIDKYPVTNAQFREFLDETGYEPEQVQNFLEHWANQQIPDGKENHPVIFVSQLDAQAYAAWMDKALPTEEEWEKAARGLEARQYPWGNTFDAEKCNSRESEKQDTTPIDFYPAGASPFGCIDLAGNCFEWTCSWYDEGQRFIVVRGGSWNRDKGATICSNRDYFEPASRYNRVGFRCVKHVAP